MYCRFMPFYAALLAVMFVVLSIRISRLHRGLSTALGDAAHNCSVPFVCRQTLPSMFPLAWC